MSSKTQTTATKKEATPALVPKRRFPEFRNDVGWAECQLSEITKAIFDGTHQTPTYTDEGVPFYSVENLVSGNANKFISRADYELATKKNKPEKDDVLITRIGKIGYSQVVSWSHDFSIYVTLAVIKKDGRFNSQFLHQFIQSALYQKEIFSKSLLSAVPCKINMDSLRATHVLLASPAEQQKIAECLSSVDELMAAQARKVDALKTHKKGLMQQLFPREGETQPRLRFPEFQNAGEWVESTIGDLKPFVTSGSRGWAPFYAEKGELFVRITNLWRGSIYLDLTDSKFVQLPPGANEGVRTQLKEHDVLISITADIGIIGYVDESVPSPAYINQHIALVRFDAGQLCGKYVAYFLASEKSQRLFRASTDTGTKAGMSLIGIQKINLMLPRLPEQQRIAMCLSSLDALITAETQKLEALKTHKKGLMQQLFPSPEEVEA